MLRPPFLIRLLLITVTLTFVGGLKADKARAQRLETGSRPPVRIVNGYPQLEFHGRPFFAHSAAFFYNRIPRDQWGASLAKLKSMGINTVDLYITWNWHEPEEGKLDFDGHTNPRRDVKGLLAMIDEMGFSVIARPGPVILNEWKNGGYPDWLLARPEYKMSASARVEGHYPPLSGLSPTNSEEASRQWLANETHLKYTRKWFGDVMRELLKDRQKGSQPEGPGNLIAIQLDDDQAINRANYNGPIFWKYMETLAGYLREAGATAPVYINPTDMRVSAAGAPRDIGAMGQWYFNFGSDPALRWEDTATLQFYTETLKTQPAFPPMIVEYQAGWYGTGDDAYAKTADPTNTLLSSRLMIGNGLRGLNYFPAQDTIYPAGYEVPWTNHHYTWESALTLARDERPRADALHRNGRLIAGLGEELATAHKAADLGLVYPISAYDQAALTRDDVMRVSRAQMQIQQFCQLNQLAVEYLDLEFQPLETLKRHKAVLLPVFDDEALKKTTAQGREEISAANEPSGGAGEGEKGRQGDGGKWRLSSAAQRKLVDYVNAGGILICTPAAPRIKELSGNDRVMVAPDFWRAVPIEPGKAKPEDVVSAVQNSAVEFVSRLSRLGVNRRVKARVAVEGSARPVASSAGASIEPNFVATQLINDGDGRRNGFLNLVNFDDRHAMRVNLNVADAASPGGRLELPEFRLRPRDALTLPLRLSLGNDAEIVYATAELVSRAMAGGKIAMRFYAPDPAQVVLKLPRAPRAGITIDGAPAKGVYDDASQLMTVKIESPKRGPKAKDEDELAGRREHEHDIEIFYEEKDASLQIKSARLVFGEENEVEVEVGNRVPRDLDVGLGVTLWRGIRPADFTLQVHVKAQSSQTFKIKVPIKAGAVKEDTAILQAYLADSGAGAGRNYRSLPTAVEIRPRFEWQIFPQSAWPLRADTRAPIAPPLLYPADDTATAAKFNLRMGNNSAGEITINRSALTGKSLPLKLRPDEEYLSEYTYNFAPGTKAALNPFVVTITDGKLTETARVNFVALKKGEAVAFAYDIDGDGFEDYVLENDFLRLIVSPNAGARAFVLINKRTGVNVFTSVGGLRDKFVELDPQDPTRNPRRKYGVYGTFNRPYKAEIKEGMGKRVALSLRYDAPDLSVVWPSGGAIERVITLNAGEESFTVDYRVTPQGAPDGKQSFWASSSIVAGDPNLKANRFAAADGAFNFDAAKLHALKVSSGWVATRISEAETFAILWRPDEVSSAEVEMKEFSSFINLKFAPFNTAEARNYRLAFYFGVMKADQVAAARTRILGG